MSPFFNFISSKQYSGIISVPIILKFLLSFTSSLMTNSIQLKISIIIPFTFPLSPTCNSVYFSIPFPSLCLSSHFFFFLLLLSHTTQLADSPTNPTLSSKIPSFFFLFGKTFLYCSPFPNNFLISLS